MKSPATKHLFEVIDNNFRLLHLRIRRERTEFKSSAVSFNSCSLPALAARDILRVIFFVRRLANHREIMGLQSRPGLSRKRNDLFPIMERRSCFSSSGRIPYRIGSNDLRWSSICWHGGCIRGDKPK
jgi:hypothetical protein